jgi:BNR repeat-like domain
VRRSGIARLFVLGTVAATTLAVAAAGGSATAQSVGGTTVPVRVSGPAGGPGGSRAVGRNVNVSNENGAQSETGVAVDPTDFNHMLASVNDLTTTARVWESTDRGRHWADSGFSTGLPFCYDTWLAFNAAGDAFVAYECGDQRIAYKLHGTTTWVKTTLQNSSLFPDRDMVAVDTSPTSAFSGSVYVGYDEAAASNAAHVWHSLNGQSGWTKSPTINSSGDGPTIGNNIAVAPDGTVYASWLDYSHKRLWVDKSTDGGATWGTDHLVTNYRINTALFFISIPPQPDRGVLPMPFTTVIQGGPNAGRLVVTYFDQSPTGPDTNAYVRYSDDGGVTWSSEIQVNDDTVKAYQFHTAIAASPTGTLAYSFYDTRNDQPANKKTDRYIAYSTDGGATWTANVRITSAMSDESSHSGDPNDYGDYQGLAASATGFFEAVWTDSRVPGARAEDTFVANAKP